MSEIIETDVLIIGSGLAGLIAAIKLVESGVAVVLACKTTIAESNTHYAQGGIAASTNVLPPIKSHIEDTIKAGAGLVDEKIADEIIAKSWQLIQVLKEYGVNFDCAADGSFALAREGGHSSARIYHTKDATGLSVCHELINRLLNLHGKKNNHHLKILEHAFATELILQNGNCGGAELICQSDMTPDKGIKTVLAKHTILATGGLGQVFSRTTNPIIATGDGIALAYRAGAELIDMEFVQFHPTALYLQDSSGAPAFLISEAIRGAGATLVDHNNNRFMERFHPAGELATRDVIAQSMHALMEETGQKAVYIDFRPIGKEILEQRFPNILHHLRQCGINALEEPVPVSPAAHYFMGGIKTDCSGKTSIPFLYAIGECACTGLHGANRLASNSLLEAGVMGIEVAELIHSTKDSQRFKPQSTVPCASFSPLIIPADLLNLRRIMFEKVGVVRNATSLQNTLEYLKNNISNSSYTTDNAQAANILLLAKLIAESALLREESRGSHFRSDYPGTNNKFAYRQIVTRKG